MSHLGKKLLEAASDGNPAACRKLLVRGAGINEVDSTEWGALHRACEGGHLDVCLVLLEFGVNIHVSDGVGFTPLHWAAWRGHASICLLLLEHGSEALALSGKGKTALDMAIENNKEACVNLLKSWIASQAARAAIEEITADVSLKAAAP